MSPLDLLRSRDGSMSITKVAATMAHFLMAATFFRLQVMGEREFNEALWMVYGGFAILHATIDKTSAMVKDFKERKLDSESIGPQYGSTTTTTTVTNE